MAKYTVELGSYLEFLTEYRHNHDDVDNIIIDSRPIFFGGYSYNYVDDKHKQELELKILRHFYFRELGFETTNLFMHRFKTRFYEIIEGYNKMLTEEIKGLGLFDSYNLSSESLSNSDMTSSGTSKNNGVSKFSDTPQGGLDGIRNDKYLTNINMADNDSSMSNSGNTKMSSKSRQKGWTGDSYYKKMLDVMENKIVSVDQLVINELESMFMGIW